MTLATLFKKKCKVVFLASGRGSNLLAVLKEIQSGKIRADVLAIISENPDSKALEIAEQYKIKPVVVPFRDFKGRRDEFDRKLNETLAALSPDLIIAAGYMKILAPLTIRSFKNRIINIHPSLLPAFPGINSQKQAFDYGVKFTGCTAHFVDEGTDTGPIIMQSVVEISKNMTEKDVNLAILREEHKILPMSVKYFCENKLLIEGRKVTIK